MIRVVNLKKKKKIYDAFLLQRHVMCSNDNQGNPKRLCKTFWIYALQTLPKFFFPKHWLLNNTVEQPEGQ